MKLDVHKNHFGGQILYRSPNPPKNGVNDFKNAVLGGKIFAIIAWVGLCQILFSIFQLATKNHVNYFTFLIGLFLISVPYVTAKFIRAKLNENDGKEQFFHLLPKKNK